MNEFLGNGRKARGETQGGESGVDGESKVKNQDDANMFQKHKKTSENASLFWEWNVGDFV